ncbi:hypothetical protein DMB44_09020 [Thermoplasma sp. Kam2015]|uniref:DNA double-strand break repair nuclease NurA n=1 Tax=Thermoplasma sp. Kam2015 TaxID=2094122 RepID=UPI000D9CAB1E|nr:DNA double-strand break repair nuclease NurA [Thermoplasma sp. Kam2015]PYB67463.1 hypothetical protein DMB44_09020 [Thermoplasma sp. Kam2015]
MDYYSKLIISNDFNKLIVELQNSHINFNKDEISLPISFNVSDYDGNGNIKVLENENAINLVPELGYEYIRDGNRLISGYDESLISIPALEGIAFMFAHSLVILNAEKYIPIVKLSLNFYTRSRALISNSTLIKYAEDASVDSKKDYVRDKSDLLINFAHHDSIILIDGPLIGGQVSDSNIDLNRKLLKKGIIPVYIVKNSNSSLIVDNLYNGQYNSDFEFAFKTLKKGQRTSLYHYQDMYSKDKNKIFTYIKPYSNVSPIRLELHETTYKLYESELNNIFDSIYYLFLAQGNSSNPQPRIVAIAEAYAREVLRAIDVNDIIFKSGLIPTMNYTRFGW